MTPDSLGPLSRPFPLHRLTPQGVDVEVETTPEERAALAADLRLAAIPSLRATFRVTGTSERVRVTGRVEAEVEQICVVSLDPFAAKLDEEVEIEFGAAQPRRASGRDIVDVDLGHDPPDELVGDHIDLGTITAEFLALGLDPYPRKPGVAFEAPETDPGEEGPFARLAALRPREGS